MKFILTNNPLVKTKLGNSIKIEFCDVSLHQILLLTRDYIHKGYKLLSHPLSGSIKPNETLYKSIMLDANIEKLDMQSLSIIENSIMLAKNFADRDIKIMQQHKDDMMTVDLSIISGRL
ncbi:MAG: GrdX family protein [Firmicutes bacterium]|nr:GrdX family protein [Bacillota bacterium]